MFGMLHACVVPCNNCTAGGQSAQAAVHTGVSIGPATTAHDATSKAKLTVAVTVLALPLLVELSTSGSPGPGKPRKPTA